MMTSIHSLELDSFDEREYVMITSCSQTLKTSDTRDSDEKKWTCIFADLLIPGRCEPLKNAAVVIEDGIITYVVSQSTVPPAKLQPLPTRVPVLMPGFWDCHIHFTGVKSPSFPNIVSTPPAVCGANMVRSFYDTLMAGCTSVRDLGSYALEASQAIEDRLVLGPHVYGAGAAISQTGGSCDAYELPIGWVTERQGLQGNAPDYGSSQLAIADGLDDFRKMIRLQLRRGASVIMVCASGGVMSMKDDPKKQQLSDNELQVISNEAKRAGRGVAVHAHGKAGVMAALQMDSCVTIEHGTYIDEEAADLIKKKGVILVATRFIIEVGMKNLDRLPSVTRAKMIEVNNVHKQAYALCVKKGVKIALGTDICSCDPSHMAAAGKSGFEIGYAVNAGLSLLQAIEAATANGPATLGPQAPLSGQIKIGDHGDVIAFVENPLDNPQVFNNVANVSHVWKDGQLVKAPGLRNQCH